MTVFINGFVAPVQVCAGLLFGLFYLCLILFVLSAFVTRNCPSRTDSAVF